MLVGKLALVTGGGSGIGRAVCASLAQEGAKVVVADVNKDMALNTLRSLPSEYCMVTMAEIMLHWKSRLQSYECCPFPVIYDHEHAFCLLIQYYSSTEINTQPDLTVVFLRGQGTFLITQAAAKGMVSDEGRQDRSIVNISTILGTTGFPKMSCYVAAKSGVIGFTKTAALELAQYGIRCNTVLPGVTDTPLLSPLDEETVQTLIRRSAMRREGKPEDIASVCVFLASPKSSYVTGAAIEVTGGVSA
ncbi:unnamed protein product [Ixodes hexagonus]